MEQVINLNNTTEYFASEELLNELKSKISENDIIVNFAYTDYGGDFFDKVCIEYFSEKYPQNIVKELTCYSGENAFIFGEVAKEFIESTDNYLLGFEDLESFYYDMEYKEEIKGFEYFIESIDRDKYEISENAIDLLSENKGGSYSVLTSGLDYSESDLIEYCINEGILKEKIEAEK